MASAETESEDTVYVVSGTGIRNGRYHPNPDCRHLKQATKVFEKQPENVAHLKQCDECKKLAREAAEDRFEAELSDTFGRDVEAGEDFVVVETDDGFKPILSDELERQPVQAKLTSAGKEAGCDV